MSLSWSKRKDRLGVLLQSQGDEGADSLALDRLLHGQNVIGKTSKTTEVDALRFQDKDLAVVGTLEYGQYGVIDVVNCKLDNRVYIRKSTEKRFALRTRDQCFPQFERDILLQAAKTDSLWAPHLLCAFHTPTHLNLVMTYAEGGNLWDVLESSPYDGKITEDDLRWWTPQIVSAIHWCHSQGFAHRDIKPHNFVLTPGAHILLIDFGSAAPLLPPASDGSQTIPKRYCLVPCGTCDYVSPEILQAHEEALVALEMEDDDDDVRAAQSHYQTEGYGLETDWWSLGAMLYEMAYGVAPFFANDIRQTYLKIMDHKRSLRFDKKTQLSPDYKDFLSRLLTTADQRIGRNSIMEIMDHILFKGLNWSTLHINPPPLNLHLPQFIYPESNAPPTGQRPSFEESSSQPFAFSALFVSSPAASSPGVSALHATPSHPLTRSSTSREDSAASFIGFSWGPTKNAFPDTAPYFSTPAGLETPKPQNFSSYNSPHTNTLPVHPNGLSLHSYPFATPIRGTGPYQTQTLPRPSTIRRTAPRRAVSDREAMKQLVDCVGMSARKKVLESGRKPRILTSFSRTGTIKKELRFLPSPPMLSMHSHSSASLLPKLAGPIFDMPITSGSEDTDSEGPPSPSPSPRPSSATSRRSGTPTITGTFSQRYGQGTLSISNTVSLNLPPPVRRRSVDRRPVVDTNVSVRTTNLTLEDRTLDALERKYNSIIEDILDIERRLSVLATRR